MREDTRGASGVRLMWAAPDHASLVREAVRVAGADGLTYLEALLGGGLLERLCQGAIDADYPASGGYVLHLYHFHNPWTHQGFARSCASAAHVATVLYADALGLWHRGSERSAAVYELGRACHLLADCWIPYHAAGTAFCGHGPYESWLTADGRYKRFLPRGGGRYEWRAVYEPRRGGVPHALDSRSPWAWVDLAAHESYPWFEDYLDGCAGRTPAELEASFPAAAAVLVPGVVRYLAGYLHLFFSLAGEAGAGGGSTGAGAGGAGSGASSASAAGDGRRVS